MYSFCEHCYQVEQEGRESTINELDDYDDNTIQVDQNFNFNEVDNSILTKFLANSKMSYKKLIR